MSRAAVNGSPVPATITASRGQSPSSSGREMVTVPANRASGSAVNQDHAVERLGRADVVVLMPARQHAQAQRHHHRQQRVEDDLDHQSRPCLPAATIIRPYL